MISRAALVGVSCAPTSLALRQGVADINVTPPGAPTKVRPARLIVGVATDGSREVIVHTRGLADTARVMDDGVYVLRDSVAAPPDLIAVR
jgi:hypothetical protein